LVKLPGSPGKGGAYPIKLSSRTKDGKAPHRHHNKKRDKGQEYEEITMSGIEGKAVPQGEGTLEDSFFKDGGFFFDAASWVDDRAYACVG
jgi:hypothetical protein